jgi:BON domain-containing protein
MGKRQRRAMGWLLCGAALCCCGCKEQDVDRLSKLGGKLGQKAGTLLAGGNGPLTRSLSGVRLHWGAVAVDARVAARLSWDKNLEGLPIQVVADGTEVKLRGKVPDPAKRRRALDLATNTIGVEKVTDEMEGE